jgi:hypothetical protein
MLSEIKKDIHNNNKKINNKLLIYECILSIQESCQAMTVEILD